MTEKEKLGTTETEDIKHAAERSINGLKAVEDWLCGNEDYETAEYLGEYIGDAIELINNLTSMQRQ